MPQSSLLALITGVGGLAVSAFATWALRRFQHAQAEVAMLGVYDRLVQNLQAELHRQQEQHTSDLAEKDKKIAELEAEIRLLHRRRQAT